MIYDIYLDQLIGGMRLNCDGDILCISVVDAVPSPTHPRMFDERSPPSTAIERIRLVVVIILVVA